MAQNASESDAAQYTNDELDAVNVRSAGGYYGRPRYVVSYVQDDGRGGRGRKTFETEDRARLVAAALVFHGRAEEGTVEVRYEEDYGYGDDADDDEEDDPELVTDGGQVMDEEEDAQTRFEFVEENYYGNKYEADHTAHSFYRQASEVVDEILTRTFSPNGVSGKGRTVYEVLLKPEVEAFVPDKVAEGAAFFDLDVTAVESRYVNEATEQRVLLLEPSDTDRYPRNE